MISESRKMAIINLTSDYPNTYTVQQLSAWAGINWKSVDKICKKLELDVYRGKQRQMGHNRPISGKNFYFK